MVRIVIDISKCQNIGQIEETIKKSYENNEKDIILVFDVTRANVTSIGNIPKLIKLIDKFKKDEDKLSKVEIICPKDQKIKRGIIKKCVKSSKNKKPIYLIEKL